MFLKAIAGTAGVLATLCLAAFIGYTVVSGPNLQKHRNPPVDQMTIEQKASHMVVFYKKDSPQGRGLCTATAIGPHAILTATHCDDITQDDAAADYVEFDLSMHKYNIIAAKQDDRDHLILLLDGPAFLNIEQVIEAVPVSGANARFYGFGEGVYPSTLRTGKVLPNDDPSEIDAAAGKADYSNAVYHGDSGSAIYNDKGEIVGLVTYSLDVYDTHRMSGFALGFSKKDLETAANFGGVFPDYSYALN